MIERIAMAETMCDILEVNKMSSEKCGCDYLNVDANIFKIYPQDVQVSEGLSILPAQFHQLKAFKKVIRIAAVIPETEKMNDILKANERDLERFERDITEIRSANTKKLDATIKAIEGSFANVLVDSPFTEDAETIKFLAKYAKNHKLKMSFWREKLLIHLLGDPENNPLDQIEYWNEYCIGIKALIKEFDLPEDKFKESLLLVAEKERNEHPIACLEAMNKMGCPIDYKPYLVRADEYIKTANNLSCDDERHSWTNKGCELYEYIAKYYQIGSRSDILKVWETEKDSYYKSKTTIRAASKIIGFKYKTHGLWYR